MSRPTIIAGPTRLTVRAQRARHRRNTHADSTTTCRTDSGGHRQHWQIAFGRRHHPQLRAQLRVVGRPKDDVSDVTLILGIENYGRAIAKFPMLQIVKGPCQHIQDATVRRRSEIPPGLPLANGMVNEQIFAGGPEHVVHAGQALDVVMYEARCSNNISYMEGMERVAVSLEVRVAAEGAPVRTSTVELTDKMLDDAHDDQKSFVVPGS